MTNESVKPPMWFWSMGVIALIWNAMGVMAYLVQAYMTPEALAALSEAEQALNANVPAWATAGFAIGVFGGAAASIFLLMRKRIAYLLFVISLVGVFVQNLHTFFMSNTIEVMGSQAIIFPLLIVLIGIGLILLSKKGKENNWLS